MISNQSQFCTPMKDDKEAFCGQCKCNLRPGTKRWWHNARKKPLCAICSGNAEIEYVNFQPEVIALLKSINDLLTKQVHFQELFVERYLADKQDDETNS